MPIPAELAALAARRVPRYTSYPPATQFSAEVGPETYAAWLGALAPDMPVSAYVHVPFCKHLCFYCGCHTRAERSADAIADYAAALVAEIGTVAGALPGRSPLAHLHWGGGTPTELGPAGMARVLEALDGAFSLGSDFEHAIELDPRRLDRGLVRALAALRVNRVSLGVQTFDPVVQKAIGRVQPFDAVRRAVAGIREEGIDAISFDLMYGLPGQTLASVKDTVAMAAHLRPQRVSAFGYAHVPWMKKVQGGIAVEALPGAGERFAQMEAIRDGLVEAGYVRVGFDHFALPDDPLAKSFGEGRLHRNFQGYTTDAAPALIGFGASAIGRLPAGYVQNTPDIGAYLLAVSEGRLATARGCALSREDRLRAALIEDVLCDGAVRLKDETRGGDIRPAMERLEPLLRSGLVVMDEGGLTVTEDGWPFARLVASAFDAYLPEEPKGHSLAV
jgi:oxygen-independent coproporphyrinogen-3 oxidase